jgi:hypothetical protein
MSSLWDRFQLELHELVSKIEGALIDPKQSEHEKEQEIAVQDTSDWLDFGVAEGDGCRRLEPSTESEHLPAESIIHFNKGDNKLHERAHYPTATDSEHRFAMMQKVFDCLTVIKMYADIVITDYALVNSSFFLVV